MLKASFDRLDKAKQLKFCEISKSDFFFLFFKLFKCASSFIIIDLR